MYQPKVYLSALVMGSASGKNERRIGLAKEQSIRSRIVNVGFRYRWKSQVPKVSLLCCCLRASGQLE